MTDGHQSLTYRLMIRSIMQIIESELGRIIVDDDAIEPSGPFAKAAEERCLKRRASIIPTPLFTVYDILFFVATFPIWGTVLISGLYQRWWNDD